MYRTFDVRLYRNYTLVAGINGIRQYLFDHGVALAREAKSLAAPALRIPFTILDMDIANQIFQANVKLPGFVAVADRVSDIEQRHQMRVVDCLEKAYAILGVQTSPTSAIFMS